MTTPSASVLVRCGSCNAAVPAAAFCAICGTRLTGSTPEPSATLPSGGLSSWPVPAEQAGAPTVTWSSLPRRRSGRWLIPLVAVAAAAAVAVMAEETHTITGTLTLMQVDDIDAEPGDHCTGQDGYSDIGEGTEITVQDESGTVLASSSLGPGRSDGLWCSFDFTLPDVARARHYQVAAGNTARGTTTWSHDEMVADSWRLDLSLGS